MQGWGGAEQGEPTPPLTLLSRQVEGSLAEQHSPLTFLQVSYSLPRKASGTLVCLRVSSNRYLERGKTSRRIIFCYRCGSAWVGGCFLRLCAAPGSDSPEGREDAPRVILIIIKPSNEDKGRRKGRQLGRRGYRSPLGVASPLLAAELLVRRLLRLRQFGGGRRWQGRDAEIVLHEVLPLAAVGKPFISGRQRAAEFSRVLR